MTAHMCHSYRRRLQRCQAAAQAASSGDCGAMRSAPHDARQGLHHRGACRCAVLCRAVLCCAALHCAVPCGAAPCRAGLRCAVRRFAVLLCCAGVLTSVLNLFARRHAVGPSRLVQAVEATLKRGQPEPPRHSAAAMSEVGAEQRRQAEVGAQRRRGCFWAGLAGVALPLLPPLSPPPLLARLAVRHHPAHAPRYEPSPLASLQQALELEVVDLLTEALEQAAEGVFSDGKAKALRVNASLSLLVWALCPPARPPACLPASSTRETCVVPHARCAGGSRRAAEGSVGGSGGRGWTPVEGACHRCGCGQQRPNGSACCPAAAHRPAATTRRAVLYAGVAAGGAAARPRQRRGGGAAAAGCDQAVPAGTGPAKDG